MAFSLTERVKWRYNVKKSPEGRENPLKNVLLNIYEFQAPWAYETLKEVLRPDMRVCILTMTHGDEIPDRETWEKWYRPGGHVYGVLTGAFGAYGIPEESIRFVGLYHDDHNSAADKINHSDVIFVTGGLPDRFFDRMVELDLVETVQRFRGLIMGCSAGAMVQMGEYHITPDEDYDAYGYYPGLGLLDGFEPEVHFAASPVQMESIRRYRKERGKPVYAMTNNGGLLVDGGKIITMGDVTVFSGEEP